MDSLRTIAASAVLLIVWGCGPAMRTDGAAGTDGVIESIGHLDRSSTAGVAGVLASGSLKTPSGASAAPAGAAPAAAGAVAGAIAQPSAETRSEAPGYRVSVRLDSGTLKSVDLADVAALRVGQRVHIDKDRVVPQ